MAFNAARLLLFRKANGGLALPLQRWIRRFARREALTATFRGLLPCGRAGSYHRAVQTLAVYLGDFSKLDAAFRAKAEDGVYSFVPGQRPAHDFGPTVLLASAAHKSDGSAEQCYLLVGALLDSKLSDDRETLSFSEIVRFIVPIVCSTEADDARRTDLLGDVLGWGPHPLAYLPEGAAQLALDEAAELLRPRQRS